MDFTDTKYLLSLLVLHLTDRSGIKSKDVPVLFLTEYHAMKAHWENRGIEPIIP